MTAWQRLTPEKKRAMQAQAESLVSGSIIENAAGRFIAMVLCEAAEAARDAERGKWMDGITEYFDGPTAEDFRAYIEDRGTKREKANE